MHGFSRKTYWIALAVVLALCVAYAYQRDLYGLYRHRQSSEIRVRELRQELDELEQREQQLTERVNGLDSDPVEMEAAIRRNKNLVREGEKVYRIELEADPAEPAQQGVRHKPDTRNPAE
jgi:cell division protein FtsB